MSAYEELEAMSLEDLKGTYGRLSRTTVKGLGFYREEIARREAKAMEEQMQAMTRQVRNMTIAILLLTVVNVVAVCVPLAQAVIRN